MCRLLDHLADGLTVVGKWRTHHDQALGLRIVAVVADERVGDGRHPTQAPEGRNRREEAVADDDHLRRRTAGGQEGHDEGVGDVVGGRPGEGDTVQVVDVDTQLLAVADPHRDEP